MRTDGRTDRQTDMTKPIVAFRNVANATKTYVIGVFSSGIFFIPRFIILDQLVQKLRLMDTRITLRQHGDLNSSLARQVR